MTISRPLPPPHPPPPSQTSDLADLATTHLSKGDSDVGSRSLRRTLSSTRTVSTVSVESTDHEAAAETSGGAVEVVPSAPALAPTPAGATKKVRKSSRVKKGGKAGAGEAKVKVKRKKQAKGDAAAEILGAR